ncbi:MAG: hypothetical protein ACI91F_000560 [Candidatus Binatia bacterium]|jgi:hypothetical protein
MCARTASMNISACNATTFTFGNQITMVSGRADCARTNGFPLPATAMFDCGVCGTIVLDNSIGLPVELLSC